MSLWGVGKSLLKLVPGVGNIVSGLELAGNVAAVVGGDTGSKIQQGVQLVTEGLRGVEQQPLTPDQRLALEQRKLEHDERMEELGLADTQGGRDLAKAEIASEDQYVRRTRPMLLRVYGIGSLVLVFACVAAVLLVLLLCATLTAAEGEILVQVVTWACASVSGVFLMMYRAYVGKRTAEKLTELTGHAPDGLMDKLIKIKTGGA
ncbi:MAG: hypothetical protein AB7E47_05880 [Desulfovibrionaceae bacterium]